MNQTVVAESTYRPELVASSPFTVSPSIPPQPSILTIIADAARDPSTNVGNMEALLRMQREFLTDEARQSFNRDYMSAKREMPRVKKDGKVEYAINKAQPDGPKKEAFRFASYENIEAVIAPIEEKYGFAHFFDSRQRAGEGGGITTIVTLIHRDGHERTTEFSAGLDTSGGKSNLQGMHSSHSLGKRVALMSAWGIVHEGKDDGGEGDKLRFITDEQKAELVALQIETKTDTTRFLQHYEIKSLDEMESKSFTGAKNALLMKKGKAA